MEMKRLNEYRLETYWICIPIGKENALSYKDLQSLWGISERATRKILHHLSAYDNGDDFILVRSARSKGFYRTDDAEIIKAYRSECLNKGKSIFAPVKKINRVLNANTSQLTFENNLRSYRESKGLKQKDVCQVMQLFDRAFDVAMLSKMENNICLPTPIQLSQLANIYDVEASDLVHFDLYIGG